MNIVVNLFDSEVISVKELKQKLFNNADCYLTKDGQYLLEGDLLHHNDVITQQPRFRGGKGGFGSMLRAMGSQIEKTTNREACRDLSGRRMRDVNNEKKMAEWVRRKGEQEEEREKSRVAKLERQLQRPKHFFNDPGYEKSLESTSENVDEALKSGLVAHKRSLDQSKARKDPLAKKTRWMGFDEDSSDSDSDDEVVMSQTPTVMSQSAQSTAEPTVTSQANEESSMTSQSTVEPSVTSQSTTEPTMTSQANEESSMTSQSTVEPSVTSQSTAEPTMTSQSITEPSVTSQSFTEPTMTSQSTAEPSVTSQSSTEPSVTSQSTTEPSVTLQSTAEPTMTSQSTTEPIMTSQSSTEPQ